MTTAKLKRPDQIKAYLDRFVIGQDEAKMTLSVAVYNHYKRILHKDDPDRKADVEKSNVLMLGPTDSGKTFLCKTIAQMLGVPFYIGSATSITASGYVGDDIETLVTGLLMNCNYDIRAAQQGIIFIDEIDKTAKKSSGVSVVRDVSGECVQQGLLKMIEGHTVGVPPFGGRKHPEQPLLYVDTSDILFICAGAFVGLEDIIARRTGKDRSRIGFRSTEPADSGYVSPFTEVTAQDLRDFGMIPEFVGRVPVVTYVDPLDRKALERILVEPVNSLVSQYKELLREDGVSLSFSPEAISEIAGKACDLGTGARGLRSVMEATMRDIMFSAPRISAKKEGMTMTVTPDMVHSDRKEIKKAQ